MTQRQFEYGPIALGTYKALLWLSLLIAWVQPQMLTGYILFLIFLAVLLRPILEWTGLYALYESVRVALEERLSRRGVERRRAQIERRERDARYRASRARDPRLPKNW